jgi:hypothetical protein
MMALDATPSGPPVRLLAGSPTHAGEASPSPAPMVVAAKERAPTAREPYPHAPPSEDDRSIPPTVGSEPRLPKMSLIFSVGLLAAGLSAVAFMYARSASVFAESNRAAASGADDQQPCVAELELRDLPSPHEVLIALGRAPLEAGPLPSGVPLELVVTAPDHRPERVMIAPEADWQLAEGRRVLELQSTLAEGGAPFWPPAAAGEIGGVGPAGTIRFSATPKDAELWLVAGAGDDATTTVRVPCRSEARLLVVNPARPEQQRRISVEPALLRAAAESGPASLSVRP